MYQIFKLIEPQKSMIKSPYLLINIDKRQWNHDLDDQEIEVIEVTGNTVDSSFFNYEELVFGMARGHHFWHQTDSLFRALNLIDCEEQCLSIVSATCTDIIQS